MGPLRLAVSAVVAFALLAPAVATATTNARVVVFLDGFGTDLYIDGGAEVNNVTMAPVRGDSTLVSDPAGVGSSDGSCTQVSPTTVDCPPAQPGRGISGGMFANLGDGNDRLSGEMVALYAVVQAGAGDDTVQFDKPASTMNGGAGTDVLVGGPGFQRLTGGDDADWLVGGGGADELDGGLGSDFLDGGSGADTIDYSSRSTSVFVAIDMLANDGAAGEGDFVVPESPPSATAGDTIRGGSAADFLIGDAGANTLQGGAGNDVLFGVGGNDTLFGEQGDDYAAGGDGADKINAGAGTDTLNGDAGDDTLHANAGDEDRDAAPDSVSGGAGVDSYVALYPPDICFTFPQVSCAAQQPSLISLDNVANDNAEGDNIRSDVEAIFGHQQPDIFVGNSGSQTFVGGDGADRLAPRGGGDLVYAQAGDDLIDVRDGVVDGVDCGAGTDFVLADAGDQHVNCETVGLPAAAARVGTRAARERMLARLRAAPPRSQARR